MTTYAVKRPDGTLISVEPNQVEAIDEAYWTDEDFADVIDDDSSAISTLENGDPVAGYTVVEVEVVEKVTP
jgi:hypothetical protein